LALPRAALIAAEVALSFVLLAGTGRLVLAALDVNPGFEPQNVLTFTTTSADYNFVHQLQQGLLTIPAVQSASLVSHLPLDDSYRIGMTPIIRRALRRGNPLSSR
jgi:hypothetical protein